MKSIEECWMLAAVKMILFLHEVEDDFYIIWNNQADETANYMWSSGTKHDTVWENRPLRERNET